MRRFAICLAILIALTLAGVTAIWFATRPAHRINEETVGQLKQGMTLAEIEAILGVPPGDYRSRQPTVVTAGRWIWGHLWQTDDLTVVVLTDETRTRAVNVTVNWHIESWWTKLRRWLRLE